MRTLTLLINCDSCGEELEENDTRVVSVQWGKRAGVVDVCTACLDEISSYSFVLNIRPTESSSNPAIFPCPHCDQSFTTQRGATRHVTVVHTKKGGKS